MCIRDSFLRRATELCPTVLFAQTKIDLYPAWERIVELNRGHLERQGLPVPIVAVSSTLRTAALARRDRELNDRSRFPALLQMLNETIVGPAKSLAGERATSDVRSLVGLVRSELEQERGAISDPTKVEASLAELQRAKERLEHLKGPAARWNVLLGDRVGDLSSEVNHRFRSGMRTVSRTMDERVEALTKGTEWDELSRHLQTLVADEVTRAFVALEQGREGIRADVVTLLQEEHLALPSTTRRAKPLDVSELWQGKALDDQRASTSKRAFQTGLTGIKGAQSGVMMFGMLGGFLPGAAAVLMASNPVLLGVGAVFGGMQLAEDRKRKVAMRRQAARGQVRQFLDDVQFEVGNSLTNLVRDVQRELRDEFTERITQLQRSYAEAANRAQGEAQRGQQAMQTRSGEIDQQLARLAAIDQLAAQGAPS